MAVRECLYGLQHSVFECQTEIIGAAAAYFP